MRYRTFLMFFCSFVVVLLTGQVAYAQPYVDTGFTGRNTIGDGDLVVARENYNSATHQQAIYFRMAAALTDATNYEIGGTITFPPDIYIVDVYYSGVDLNNSDADWAIAGGDYSGSTRGFDSQDTISWDLHSVSFNAHFSNPVDDFRVVIEYDDPLAPGESFDIQLLTGPGQYQPAHDIGIQVGNTDGIVPGSDDFGEIAQLTVPLTPGEPQPSLEQRVQDLESQVQTLLDQYESLQQRITDLEQAQGALANHTHTYMTGKGTGHNNTEVTTGPPISSGE